MKKELYDKAKEFENIFKYALKMDFLRVTPEVFNSIMEIYEEHFQKKLSKSQKQCNTCRLKAIKEIGKAYFEEQEKQEKQKEQKGQEKQEKQEGQPPKSEGKKRGRPRKLDVE